MRAALAGSNPTKLPDHLPQRIAADEYPLGVLESAQLADQALVSAGKDNGWLWLSLFVVQLDIGTAEYKNETGALSIPQ